MSTSWTWTVSLAASTSPLSVDQLRVPQERPYFADEEGQALETARAVHRAVRLTSLICRNRKTAIIGRVPARLLVTSSVGRHPSRRSAEWDWWDPPQRHRRGAQRPARKRLETPSRATSSSRARTRSVADTRPEVSKAAIHRWWGSESELALDTFLADMRQGACAHTGTLARERRARLRAKSNLWPAAAPVGANRVGCGGIARCSLSQSIEAAHGQPICAKAARRTPTCCRARATEIAPDTPIDVALDMAVGAIHYRLLLHRGPVDTRLGDATLDLLLPALKPTKEDERGRNSR